MEELTDQEERRDQWSSQRRRDRRFMARVQVSEGGEYEEDSCRKRRRSHGDETNGSYGERIRSSNQMAVRGFKYKDKNGPEL